MNPWEGAFAAAPKVGELSVQRPGSMQNTDRSIGSAPTGTMRSLAMTRSCLRETGAAWRSC
jgi:ribosomal protein S14